LKYCKKKC